MGNEGIANGFVGIQNNPGVCLTAVDINGYFNVPATNLKFRMGCHAWDGQPEYVGFNTVLGPNRPNCVDLAGAGSGDSIHGILPPASRHPGGVHCLMADGSVRFIGDNIDTGDVTTPDTSPISGTGTDVVTFSGPSPYGIWGALGSKAGNDVTAEF